MKHPHMIDAPQAIALADYDPGDTDGLSHDDVRERSAELEQRLGQLQALLYGAGKQSVLIVLQGSDTSGKDGTITHVMSQINPSGCNVANFKVPSEEEARHDFLWRIHLHTPATGMIAIFNRSHYEDVLVARVHTLVPADVWQQRYEQINHFEQMLAQNNTIILKFFLHITKDEQGQRLLAREKVKEKWWKLSVSDWEERAYWDSYQQAYADAIGRCAAPQAPWYIVPANHKWYRNYVIANTLVTRLAEHESQWRNELEERGKTELAALHKAGFYKKSKDKDKDA